MNNKITKEWILKILPHALWPVAILILSWYIYIITTYWVALPFLCSMINLYAESKEEEGRLKSLGQKTGTLTSIRSVLWSQFVTAKERSEWLWTGILSGLVCSVFILIFWSL